MPRKTSSAVVNLADHQHQPPQSKYPPLPEGLPNALQGEFERVIDFLLAHDKYCAARLPLVKVYLVAAHQVNILTKAACATVDADTLKLLMVAQGTLNRAAQSLGLNVRVSIQAPKAKPVAPATASGAKVWG